ncbi:hypothetical protein FEMY_23590 [Ferrovum myxofaciens]|uniref:Uncharacterized protein n=1 Tax=Ferrovum myxofaciens TaxID=416213 RepID=A0A149VVA9_9PROT|nr:hypothetical protein FEMY_23590 [Ferrovum myxofaciens]
MPAAADRHRTAVGGVGGLIPWARPMPDRARAQIFIAAKFTTPYRQP